MSGDNGYESNNKVFQIINGTFQQLGNAIPGSESLAPSDSHGLSPDGSHVCHIDGDGGDNGTAAVKIYQYSGGSWNQKGTTIIEDTVRDNFHDPIKCSFSSDNNTVVFSAPQK